MKLFNIIIKIPVNIWNIFRKRSKKIQLVILILLILTGYFLYSNFSKSNSNSPSYQTHTVEKQTLISSIASTGTVSSANTSEITTQATGVVKEVFVTNGQLVKAGDKIAQLDLDTTSLAKYNQSLATYNSAKSTLDSAKTNILALQATMLTKWDTFMDVSQNSTYTNGDGSPNSDNRSLPAYYSVNNDWLVAEANYKNQQNNIASAQNSFTNAYLSLNNYSPTITSPLSGTVSGLSLTPGVILANSSTNDTTSTSTTQKVASIKTNGKPQITVNLTQIDIPKVTIGNKVNVVFDAFSDKTYTGKVISLDTVGSISSGVANYPATIELDNNIESIYPNMSATVTIILDTKVDALAVPNSSITTTNNISTLMVLENGKPVEKTVEIGLVTDTMTEILTGINSGDVVITGTSSTTSTATTSQTSVFSPFGGTRSGGGNIRIQGR